MLNCKYLGLHTCRYPATYFGKGKIYHSKGGWICRRDPKTFKEELQFQAHSSVIAACAVRPYENPNQILTVDYYGNIALHTLEGQFLVFLPHIRKNQVPKSVRAISMNDSGTTLCVLSLGGNPYNGCIEIYDVTDTCITLIKTLRGNYKQCEFANNDDLFVLRETIVETDDMERKKQRDYPISEEKVLENFGSDVEDFEDSEALLETMTQRSKRIVTYYACLYKNVKEEHEGRYLKLDIYARVNCIMQNHKGQVAFANLSRMVYVMDMSTLTVLHSLSLKGNGAIAMLIYDNTDLYFSPQSNYICKFDTLQPLVNKIIDFSITQPEVHFQKTDHSWIHKNNYLAWVEKDKSIISLNEYGIFYGEFVDFFHSKEIINFKQETVFQITCCGLDIQQDLGVVAVGDFSGGIAIFAYESSEIVSKAQVPGSIRCLSWKQEQLFIGTIDGNIFVWNFPEGKEPIIYYAIGSSIVCMSWKGENLALGCSSGEIWVFYASPDIYHKFLAHETQDGNDERFGSLGLYSEIWSICWSPCGNFLASGSEDQSVRIWNTTTFEIVQNLPKHKRAVTGVRWETIQKICRQGKEIQEIMVTCSDDESLRIYDPQDWVMLYSFTTSVIQEWHTITYAAIEKGGKHVACVTQNGFVFIIDLEKMEFKNIERIHNGSVEGLDWKGKIITCSSETVCAVIDVQ